MSNKNKINSRFNSIRDNFEKEREKKESRFQNKNKINPRFNSIQENFEKEREKKEPRFQNKINSRFNSIQDNFEKEIRFNCDFNEENIKRKKREMMRKENKTNPFILNNKINNEKNNEKKFNLNISEFPSL